MANPKIDSGLQRELEVVEAVSPAGRPIAVVIEHATRVTATPSRDRGGGLRELEQRTAELQRGIVAELRRLQASDVRQLALANAIAAELTPAQVREIAEHPDVRAIRLAGPRQVTA